MRSRILARLGQRPPIPDRPATAGRRRVRGIAIALVGLAALAATMVWTAVESRETGVAQRRNFLAKGQPRFAGTVRFTIDRYDRTAQTIDATVDVRIRSTEDIKTLNFGTFSEVRDTTKEQELHWWREKRPGEPAVLAEHFDIDKEHQPEPNGPKITEIGERVTVWTTIRPVRSDAWFPFDIWTFHLDPVACVNTAEPCSEKSPNLVHIECVEVVLSDTMRSEQNAVMRVSRRLPLKVSVRRQVFVRILPIMLFSIALIYLYYVFRHETPREQVMKSLGTIAALWGLRGILVPKQILIFPTLLDYILVVLIALTFIVALIKLETGETQP